MKTTIFRILLPVLAFGFLVSCSDSKENEGKETEKKVSQEELDMKASGLTKEELAAFYADMDRVVDISCEINRITAVGMKAEEEENDTTVNIKELVDQREILYDERKEISKKWDRAIDYNKFYLEKTIAYIKRMIDECEYNSYDDVDNYNRKIRQMEEELEELKMQDNE